MCLPGLYILIFIPNEANEEEEYKNTEPVLTNANGYTYFITQTDWQAHTHTHTHARTHARITNICTMSEGLVEKIETTTQKAEQKRWVKKISIITIY